MRKIKNIAIRTMELGFKQESEKIFRSLMVAQIEQMGTLHEETLETIVLLSHNLAMLQQWDDIVELSIYLQETKEEIVYKNEALQQAICELDEILSHRLKIVG
jgi:hypothetical protein